MSPANQTISGLGELARVASARERTAYAVLAQHQSQKLLEN